MRIAQSTAVVTGGASGIGRGIAAALVDRGCRVLIADRDIARATEAAAALGDLAVAAACDVTDHNAVEAMAESADRQFGGIDLVFANAGVSISGPLLDAQVAELDWIFAVNVRGAWSTAAAFGRRIRDSGRSGHICLTGSEHSLGMQHAGIGFYTATKHAVLGMADVMRAELPPEIGISVLCPGLVATDLHLSKRNSELPPDDPGALALAGALMARGMDPRDIGRMVVDGVERGDFLIMTHACAAAAPKRRYEEIAASFEAQAPWTPGSDRYDVTTIISAIMHGASVPDGSAQP